MDFSNVPIEDDLNECEKYSSVIERYYSPRYCVNVGEPGGDYCVLIHSNRVCLVTLAPSHFLYKLPKIVSVDFQIDNNVNRLKNMVSGKFKHGAQKLKPHSPLMLVTCSDGSQHTIRSGISGKLLEVNQSLCKEPNLFLEKPQGRGYVAIVLAEISVVEQYKDSLLDEDQYKSVCDGNMREEENKS